jgi:membrane-associated phospholipid phosphatase
VNTVAKIISILFHPLLMATYLMGLLSQTLPSALFPINAESFRSFLLLIFLMTFALPVVSVSFFRIFGMVKSFSMEERSERVRPFFFIAVLYAFITWLFISKSGMNLNDSFLKLLIIIDALVLLATVITFFYKISVHSMGIMGMLGILFSLNRIAENNSLFIPTIVVLIIAGLVMSSRLQLNSHTPRQVMFGATIGFATGFFGMIFLF